MQNLHPLFVHFPIALLSVGALLEIVGILRKNENLRIAGFWSLALGLVGAAVAVLSGRQAEDSVPHEGAVHGLMEAHERFGYITLALFALLLAWRWRRGQSWSDGEGLSYGLAALAATGVLLYGSNLGGQLVYEHGVGTALTADSAGDDHDHGDDDHHGDDGDHGAESSEGGSDMAVMEPPTNGHGGMGLVIFDRVNMAEAPCHIMNGNEIMGDCSAEDVLRLADEIFGSESLQASGMDMGESMDGSDMDANAGDPAERIVIDRINMADAPCHVMFGNMIMGSCTEDDYAQLVSDLMAGSASGMEMEGMDMSDEDESMEEGSEEGDHGGDDHSHDG